MAVTGSCAGRARAGLPRGQAPPALTPAIDSTRARAADRHRHLPLHRHRGLDAAAARARRGGLRGRARRASPRAARGVRASRRCRGRHAGRRFFVAFPTAPGALAAAREAQAAGVGPIRVRMGLHTGDAARDRRGLRRRRRPSRGADRGRRARRAGARLGRRPRRSSSADELRDLGEHRLKDLARPSGSSSSATASSRR